MECGGHKRIGIGPSTSFAPFTPVRFDRGSAGQPLRRRMK
ncbi:hypothetical protein D779_1586 [Imhoffiella purpurea]|uniref:Uncharacterized protein n=1 Tax=Imhoffiella purpurea TaxID=1249627 RepID=W9V6U6_9GAMM|nr:hypothetical protein D779_1586 [Imhoffiella purpurea]